MTEHMEYDRCTDIERALGVWSFKGVFTRLDLKPPESARVALGAPLLSSRYLLPPKFPPCPCRKERGHTRGKRS
jgi:hypothetical protein